MYQREIDNLSSLQISFLEMIANNEEHLTSKENIRNYNLGTPGNIQYLRKALENKEILDFYEKRPCFLDPLFAIWFRRYFLE